MTGVAWLISVDADLGGRRFPLDAPCLVGRGPYNHVVLDDTRISRQHAKISPEAGGYVVYDLNSANGTFVNDVQVKRQKLAPADLLRFGPFRFKFELEAFDDGRTSPANPAQKKFVEVLTQVGVEQPSKIVESLDAASATNPGVAHGLSQLEEADRKLRTLYQFLQSVSTTLDETELCDRILKNLLDAFVEAEVVTIYLRHHSSQAMVPRKSLRRSDGQSGATTLPPQFYEEVVEKGRAVLSAPAGGGKKKVGSGGLAMHSPMIYDGVTGGVLLVRGVDGAGMPFNQDDLDLLTGLAAQAGLAMANARMHQESLKQQRLQQDLLLAEQIQKSFLPRVMPQVEGIEFVTEYRPAYSVGGDFYDVFWLNYDRIGLFIGDVSGKGVSAALLMARISSDLRLAAAAVNDPARAIEHVNRIVLERRQPDIFVTGVYVTLDIRTHQMTIANAGHLPPLVRRHSDGVIQRVDGGTGTAIGIFDDAEYDQVNLSLEPGDTLVLCTDGVIEATNTLGEQFSFERLEESIKHGPSRAADCAQRLLRDVRGHVGAAAQSDDLTLIVCGISAPERKRRDDEPTQTHKTR